MKNEETRSINKDAYNEIAERLEAPEKETLAEYYDVADRSAGGMGKIYFCQDKRSKEFCVLKTFKEKDERFKKFFEKEADFALRLNKHPNIVYTKTIAIEGGKYYIVMELIGKQPKSLEEEVEGRTLVQIINNSDKIEKKQVLLWALEFCEGMEYLVSRGMKAHKDIKPSNLFITEEGHLKIGDFGLANLDRKSGTKGYRAPEYFQGDKELDIRSDIYSFGLVLHELINGYNLENGTRLKTYNTTEVNKETEAVFIDPNKIESLYYLDIIKKCLQREQKDRYQSINDLKEALLKEAEKEKINYTPAKELPMTADDWFAKGYGFYMLKCYKISVPYFDKAIKLDQELYRAYYFRMLAKDKYLPRANEEIIEDAIRVSNWSLNNKKFVKEDAEIFVIQGNAQREIDEELAIELYDKAIELDHQYIDAYYNRGLTKFFLGKNKSAIKDFEATLNLNSKHEEAQKYLKLAKEKLKEQLKKALKTKKTNSHRRKM